MNRYCVPALCIGLLAAWLPLPADADQVRVAVASNFRNAARLLAQRYEEASGHELTLVFASSGKLATQIINGAPFDVLLAADGRSVARLQQAGRGLPESRFPYAIGSLVLWSPQAGLVDAEGKVLARGEFRKLAIANPRHAPYGQAAQQVLDRLELPQQLADRLVTGENIEQAMQFIISGNAELGFVAASQLAQSLWGRQGSRWQVPQELYDPIVQEAIQLTAGAAPAGFLEFLRGDTARGIILQQGYDLP